MRTWKGGLWKMDGIDGILNRKDMTFKEAEDYFKQRIPVSAAVFYAIAVPDGLSVPVRWVPLSEQRRFPEAPA